MLGLAGAQRVGKSTLALAYSEATGIPYLPTSASGTFARLGLDPKAEYPFGQRLEIQSNILFDMSQVFRQAGDRFITDRTPLDMMAYLLADVQRSNVTGVLNAALQGYLTDCYAMLNKYFSVVVIVQPGIPLIEAEGKAPANAAHMEHINALVMGLASDARFQGAHFYIPRAYLDIHKRVGAVRFAENRVIEKHASFVSSRRETNDPLILH